MMMSCTLSKKKVLKERVEKYDTTTVSTPAHLHVHTTPKKGTSLFEYCKRQGKH